jgi:hypothetical protein
MRRLVVLAGIVLLLIVVDSAARSYAGDQIERGLATSLSLEGDTNVRIGGFPFLWELVRGRFESVTISADTIEEGNIELSRVELTLEGVTFPVAQVLEGHESKAHIRSGRGSARISAPALDRALASLLPEGTTPILHRVGTIPIEGNALDLGIAKVPLPVAMDGMQYESAEFNGSSLDLTFSLAARSIPL